jgi:hypothetical protein
MKVSLLVTTIFSLTMLILNSNLKDWKEIIAFVFNLFPFLICLYHFFQEIVLLKNDTKLKIIRTFFHIYSEFKGIDFKENYLNNIEILRELNKDLVEGKIDIYNYSFETYNKVIEIKNQMFCGDLGDISINNRKDIILLKNTNFSKNYQKSEDFRMGLYLNKFYFYSRFHKHGYCYRDSLLYKYENNLLYKENQSIYEENTFNKIENWLDKNDIIKDWETKQQMFLLNNKGGLYDKNIKDNYCLIDKKYFFQFDEKHRIVAIMNVEKIYEDDKEYFTRFFDDLTYLSENIKKIDNFDRNYCFSKFCEKINENLYHSIDRFDLLHSSYENLEFFSNHEDMCFEKLEEENYIYICTLLGYWRLNKELNNIIKVENSIINQDYDKKYDKNILIGFSYKNFKLF